jgi:hypothetical protein
MAVASFWNVFELKLNVFMCLREDKRDSDLARCARVHRTWTDLALDALWYAYPRTVCENNKVKTSAIALLPRNRRQDYASRIGVLDFTNLGGILVHAMFDKLKFPKLKEVVLYNDDDESHTKFRDFRISKYLQPTLRSLKLIDNADRDDDDWTDWLTVSFLTDVAHRCPNLEEVSLCVLGPIIETTDLVRFFGSIRARAVSLEFHAWNQHLFNCDLLAALSLGERLERLASRGGSHEREAIATIQMQRFLNTNSKPFPYLKQLDLCLENEAIPLLPQCFPAVTSLRLEISLSAWNDSILKPIANMSQLQILEILGEGDEREYNNNTVPVRAFIPLGSLTRLQSLNIGTSFFPCCLSEEEVSEQLFSASGNEFLEMDASDMFSRLTALVHLSISTGDDSKTPGHLYDWISKYCPHLRSIEFVGGLDLRDLVRPHAPVLEHVKHMTFESIDLDIKATQAARIIDNFAPRLETLSFEDQNCLVKEIYAEMMKFRTQGTFKDSRGSRIRELILKDF